MEALAKPSTARHWPRRAAGRCGLLALTLCVCCARVVHAGGGPENVLLVVNARSADSLAIANHYVQWRRIPASNVLHLDYDGDHEEISLDDFRHDLLGPILSAIRQRGLENQIDYIVYSADFPWSVDARTELASLNLPAHLTPLCSTTGLTLFGRTLVGGQIDFLQLDANHYAQLPVTTRPGVESHGFHSWYGWNLGGGVSEAGGDHYLLSTMLGVTSGRGNTVEEVLAYLERSAAADGTHPEGTIYYVQNGDVRSRARHDRYPAAIEALEKLGVKAEVINAQIPQNKNDVAGAMLGVALIDWKSTNCTILPGAICEHFTSLGGILRRKADQTPLSEFLRYGAAGASGTVTEPYAMEVKFPLAWLHVHYARGCSLAEAFYQSVVCPFQLLIVGDPLCQPWANIPEVDVPGLSSGATVRGNVAIAPTATVKGDAPADRWEFFVDGLRQSHSRIGEELEWDTAAWPDGWHEVRVVATVASSIETQGRWIAKVRIDNHGRDITLAIDPSSRLESDADLSLRVTAPGAIGSAVYHDTQMLGRVSGEEGHVNVTAGTLGWGPVTLRAIAIGGGATNVHAMAKPLEIQIEPPRAANSR